MATFIPEWVKLSGRDVAIKRVLNALDDGYVVRRAIRGNTGAVDFFVQHPDKGWIAVSIDASRFAEIDPAQLFSSTHQSQFEQRLSELRALGTAFNPSGFAMESLVLLWNCTDEEVAALTKAFFAFHGIRMTAKNRFMELGAKLIGRGLAPISRDLENHLFSAYFPEAEIPSACTIRRTFVRDNSAKLEPTYLDTEQEWASKLDLNMPTDQASIAGDFSVRLINGVAGSGKTLIAVNRALLLAELFPTQRLLLLIHNTPIVADIKERLHRVRGGLPANLDLRTASSWVNGQWRAVFGRWPRLPTSPDRVQTLVTQWRLRPPQQPLAELRGTDAQLIDELDFINDGLFADEPSYQAASRAGRGFALRAKDRSELWTLHAGVTVDLAKTGMQLWSSVARELCLQTNGHDRLQKYHHILIDEAQFFVPSTLQLVKLSLAAGGQLFLCADPNQGFMKSRLSWKNAGIDVVGRTKKLRKSYRTTRAILEAATGVLDALGSVDTDDYLQPDFDGMQTGTRPTLLYVDSPHDAIERLINELAETYDTQNAPFSATLVIYGDNVPKRALYERLKGYFDGNVWWFNEDSQKKLPPYGYGRDYLRMANVDTATGLEGVIVFLLGVEHLFVDALIPGATVDENAANLEARARKLYMAMTRAGQRLILISSQRLPPEMEGLFDKQS